MAPIVLLHLEAALHSHETIAMLFFLQKQICAVALTKLFITYIRFSSFLASNKSDAMPQFSGF